MFSKFGFLVIVLKNYCWYKLFSRLRVLKNTKENANNINYNNLISFYMEEITVFTCIFLTLFLEGKSKGAYITWGIKKKVDEKIKATYFIKSPEDLYKFLPINRVLLNQVTQLNSFLEITATMDGLEYIPYFTGYKTHFFLRKIASKMFDLKFPPVLKMAISMPRETYLHLATLDSTGGSSAQMRRIWVAGFTSLLTLSPSCPAIPNLEYCWAYVALLRSTVTWDVDEP